MFELTRGKSGHAQLNTNVMRQGDPHLQAYYAARAREYERVYAKPERQPDLKTLAELIPRFFTGGSVLEVACGTGYWTQYLARTARRILAVDLAEETLAIAREKNLPSDRVSFTIANALGLPPELGRFDGAFAGFWWSHLRPGERNQFLSSLQARLTPGATVVLLDNLFVQGSSTPIAQSDAEGNTYQRRILDDGSARLVLKNFPTQSELIRDVARFGVNYRYRALDYYWLFAYEAAGVA